MNIRLYAVKLDRPLSEAERSTLARFLPPERQDRIKTSEPLCACALLCRALHELYGLEDLPQLSYGEHGKPYFASHPDVHFSLSHTRGAALLAVHNEPIGADIECLRPVSGAMRTRFHAANDADFWRLWVQRESRCKRRGISAVSLPSVPLPISIATRVFSPRIKYPDVAPFAAGNGPFIPSTVNSIRILLTFGEAQGALPLDPTREFLP